MPKRILFAMNSPNITGGAMTGLLQFLAALPDNNIQAYLVVPYAPTTGQYEFLRKFFKDIAVVPMSGGWIRPRLERGTLSRFRTILGELWYSGLYLLTIQQFKSLVRQWNIDKLYSGSLMIIGAALAAKVIHVPHIWHIKETFGKYGNTQLFYPEHIVVDTINKLSSDIIVMSNYIAGPFRAHHAIQKIKLVRDGLDLRSYEGNLRGLELRRQLAIPPDKHVVALIASLNAPWKRHDLFVRSAKLVHAQYANAHFVHFGNIPTPSAKQARYFNQLEGLVSSLGLSDVFTWAGPIYNIPQMMDSIDILVHPCPTEPFGRVAIEAMAARKPVVGSNTGGIRESVVHGETGLLSPPGDLEALAEHTLTLLSSSELRKDMGSNGYNRVQSVFSIEEHVKNMRALLLQ